MSISQTTPLRTLPEVRADVTSFLAEYTASQRAAAQQLDPNYGRLWSAIQAVVAAGGKRVRPYVMLTAYAGLGGAHYRRVLPVAAALELLHTSLLMHDDIIDRDYVRHGQDNVAGWYLKHYAHAGDQAEHYANSAALLAGDLMLSGAHELILTTELSGEQKTVAGRQLSHMLYTVAGGELLDSEASFGPLEATDSLNIALLKTASYSFVGPLILGATLAEADGTTLTALRHYGEAIGIAFQLADDLLGLYGDETTTGKSATSDLEEGKLTYLVQCALKALATDDRQRLTTILRSGHVTPAEAQTARDLITASGAVETVKTKMRELSETAQATLIETALSTEAKAALEGLTVAAIQRHV